MMNKQGAPSPHVQNNTYGLYFIMKEGEYNEENLYCNLYPFYN